MILMGCSADMLRARKWCLDVERACQSLADGSNSLAHAQLGNLLSAPPSEIAQREGHLLALLKAERLRQTALIDAADAGERQDRAYLMAFVSDLLRRVQGRQEAGQYSPRTVLPDLQGRDRAGGVA